MNMTLEEKLAKLNTSTSPLLACLYIITDDLIMKSSNWNDETEYGEPQLWLELPNNRHLEITHEENGLAKDKQYYSCRVHCSDDEFDDDKFHRTMGVVDQMTLYDLDDNNVVRDMLIWALAVANTDV